MQGVADLVDRLGLGHGQRPVGDERLLLEEAGDPVARRRKRSSLTRVWSLVVKMVRWASGSKASTISSARSRAWAQAASLAKPSRTRKPSRRKDASCSLDTVGPMYASRPAADGVPAGARRQARPRTSSMGGMLISISWPLLGGAPVAVEAYDGTTAAPTGTPSPPSSCARRTPSAGSSPPRTTSALAAPTSPATSTSRATCSRRSRPSARSDLDSTRSWWSTWPSRSAVERPAATAAAPGGGAHPRPPALPRAGCGRHLPPLRRLQRLLRARCSARR